MGNRIDLSKSEGLSYRQSIVCNNRFFTSCFVYLPSTLGIRFSCSVYLPSTLGIISGCFVYLPSTLGIRFSCSVYLPSTLGIRSGLALTSPSTILSSNDAESCNCGTKTTFPSDPIIAFMSSSLGLLMRCLPPGDLSSLTAEIFEFFTDIKIETQRHNE